MMPGLMAFIIIAEEERKRGKASFTVEDLLDARLRDILIGVAIGLSPFVFALLLCRFG